jgi:hypothetical protein
MKAGQPGGSVLLLLKFPRWAPWGGLVLMPPGHGSGPSVLLVHRHQWHGHLWQGGQCSRIKLREVERWELRIQLIASLKTVSAGSIAKELLIKPWMISGIERPLRIDISSMRS